MTEPIKVDVILSTDREVAGVHVDGHGATFQVEEPYVHSMPMDSGWQVRRYEVPIPDYEGYPPDKPDAGERYLVTIRATWNGRAWVMSNGMVPPGDQILDWLEDR